MENKQQEITVMNVNVHSIRTEVEILICKSIEDIQVAMRQDSDLKRLNLYLIQGWPHTKDDVEHSMQRYWPIRHDLVMIDGIRYFCIILFNMPAN